MPPRPSFDRALLIPIAIGLISLLGVGWILLNSDLGQSLIRPTALPSSLPTTAAETPGASPSAAITATATRPTPSRLPPTPSATLTPTSPSATQIPPTPSATLTPGQIQPLPPGKYDDMDPNIAYDRFWTVLKNPGTANAYHASLHYSDAIGNQASFRFTGKGFRLGYQRGRNFGTVTVLIDGQPYRFHEEAFDLVWSSPSLSPGDHFVQIVHESGEAINLDYIEILG